MSLADYYYNNNSQTRAGNHEIRTPSPSPSNESVDYPDGYSGNGAQPKSYPKQHSQKALRDKEEVLMSSLRKSPDYEKNDNSVRLGPNKLNTFQCLRDDKDRSTNDSYDSCEEIDKNNERTRAVSPSVDRSRSPKTNPKILLNNVTDCDRIPSVLKVQASRDKDESSSEVKRPNIFEKKTDEERKSPVVSVGLAIDDDDSGSESFKFCKVNREDGEKNAKNLSDIKSDELKPDTSRLRTKPVSPLEEKKVSFNESFNDIKIIENTSDLKKASKLWKKEKESRKENFLSVLKKRTEKFMNKSEYRVEEDYIVADKSVKLNQETVNVLKKVILGSENSSIPRQWFGQNFNFNKNRKLKYGLVQNKVSNQKNLLIIISV